jgi:hypothetical protein
LRAKVFKWHVELRDLVRCRAFLVGIWTKLKNRIHLLFTRGGRELLGNLGLRFCSYA